ncbi:hypothetical protein HYQ45_001597 [Verticillium longisporum]|uniref:Uncharacterized protein n=1 Tax=Verticillium longisporum TaxID=100787 RepID=A0A8I3AVY9_VERLO|nr:hypothetical protein HYQ44_011162 [Verticillium longisporum]KAG7141860.1 hypothetical protein HYQ45_001597 [Verticillium longisporum]
MPVATRTVLSAEARTTCPSFGKVSFTRPLEQLVSLDHGHLRLFGELRHSIVAPERFQSGRRTRAQEVTLDPASSPPRGR